MKIFVARLADGAVGGAERSAYLHYRVLNELGHEANFYSNTGFPNHRPNILPPTKFLRWAWCLLYLPFRAAFGRFDLVNPHSREDQVSLTLGRWLHRASVVWKDPGDLIHNIRLDRKGILGRINQELLIAALRRADAVYFLNDNDRQTITQRLDKLGVEFDPARFSTIPSDIYFADYDLNAQPPRQTDNLVIGTVIRLDEHKGVQYLLEAARQLNERHKNLEWWIVGDGPYRAELERQAAGLDNVKFWGNQDDISPYLVGMDIFVQPAEFEGWGRNVKEAMYFGKPVVGSNVGGIAQQINNGRTGLLFEPKNSGELAIQLERLIKDKGLRAKLGKAAKAKALKDGDFVTLVKTKILPLFERVLNRPS